MSTFNKEVGKFIDKDKSEKLRKKWEKAGMKTKSVFIGNDIIAKLQGVSGQVGFRIYPGLDDDDNLRLIFFAADDEGRAIQDTETTLKTMDGNDGGADETLSCPPVCPKP